MQAEHHRTTTTAASSGGPGTLARIRFHPPSAGPGTRVQILMTERHTSCGPYKVIGGDTEGPLQVCQLSRSSESTHFLFLRRDVALFDSTRAPDSF